MPSDARLLLFIIVSSSFLENYSSWLRSAKLRFRLYRWIVRLTAGSLLSQLTEDELRIWITVLNHGEAPSDEDLEEVIETLDNYREEQGAEGSEGQLELSDFLLVTFDYYLAMGAARMRALYIDLLLT